MKFDPNLKQKIESLALTIKEEEGRGETLKAKHLLEDLLILCTPPAKAKATRGFTRYYDRVDADILQEVRLGIASAFSSWDPEKGPFFGYMMYRPKRNVRRLKGLYPIDLPSSISDSRRDKLTPKQLAQLDRTKKSYFYGLAMEESTSEEDATPFRMAELRASVPEWVMEILIAKHVEGMTWQELKDYFNLSREELDERLMAATEILKSVWLGESYEKPDTPCDTFPESV